MIRQDDLLRTPVDTVVRELLRWRKRVVECLRLPLLVNQVGKSIQRVQTSGSVKFKKW